MQSVDTCLFKFTFFFLFGKQGHFGSLKSFCKLLSEGLDASTKQEKIIKSFFEKLSHILDAFLFVEMIYHDDFVGMIFVCKKLRN